MTHIVHLFYCGRLHLPTVTDEEPLNRLRRNHGNEMAASAIRFFGNLLYYIHLEGALVLYEKLSCE